MTRSTVTHQRLTREALAEATGCPRAAPPIRIVHIGLGAFHRAHQAWYTARASDAAEWGIAAFTGRSATAARQLAPQGGLYCLIERSDDADAVTVVSSIAEAVDGADLHRFVELLSAPETSVVTLTITEPGYRLVGDGTPDPDDEELAGDVKRLAAALASDDPAATLEDARPATSLGRLLLGLEARRRAGAGPLAIVPCDNMPDNGAFVRRGLLALAHSTSQRLADWIGSSVSFVSTSVDRITPKTTDDDIGTVARLTGWDDAAPVVTEPFRDWVLSGAFPAGRPAWETAGARFVDDIEPFERRKLWLLNGAHSLLAYAGVLRGYSTVAEAIADPVLRGWVEELWDEAARHLTSAELELPRYRADLLGRFANARIEHRLAQIGMEGVSKLRVRAAAIARAERLDGRPAHASARAIAAWISLVLAGRELPDAHAASVADARAGDPDGAVVRLLGVVDPELATDAAFVATVEAAVATLR